MKKLGFTKNEITLAFSVFVVIEIFSLWRFHNISKEQHVVGTEPGIFFILILHNKGFWGFTKDVSDA